MCGGIGISNPEARLHISEGGNTSDGDGSAGLAMTGNESIVLQVDSAYTIGHTYGSMVWNVGSRRRAMITGVAENTDTDYLGLAFYTRGTDGAGDFFESMRISHSGNVGIGNFGSGAVTGAKLRVEGRILTTNQFSSTVATGTAPIVVSSTTECTNLNAARLQGYTALGLPYLGGSVNTSINSTDGKRRFYFANNSYTALSAQDDIYFQIGTTSVARMGGNGLWNFHGDSSEQTTYRVNVRGSNGLNVEATEALSSGQKTTVLRAGGDKQWIDSYGVFKRNRQTVAENITVSSSDNCMSAGPISINNGTTVTISSGGTWSIV